MSKGLFRLLVAALIAVLPLNGHIAAGQETVIDAFGRTVSAKEGRALRNRISDLERTSGLQATTIAGVAKRLGLQYKGLSERRLFEVLEIQINQAVELQQTITGLRTEIAVLRDVSVRDPAKAHLEDAEAAFAQGDFVAAEQALSSLAFLRNTEGREARSAWVSAMKSQAQAAALQGTESAFDRAEEIESQLRGELARQVAEAEQERLRSYARTASIRFNEGLSFGRMSALERSAAIFEKSIFPNLLSQQEPEAWTEAVIVYSKAVRSIALRSNAATANRILPDGAKKLEEFAGVAFPEGPASYHPEFKRALAQILMERWQYLSTVEIFEDEGRVEQIKNLIQVDTAPDKDETVVLTKDQFEIAEIFLEYLLPLFARPDFQRDEGVLLEGENLKLTPESMRGMNNFAVLLNTMILSSLMDGIESEKTDRVYRIDRQTEPLRWIRTAILGARTLSRFTIDDAPEMSAHVGIKSDEDRLVLAMNILSGVARFAAEEGYFVEMAEATNAGAEVMRLLLPYAKDGDERARVIAMAKDLHVRSLDVLKEDETPSQWAETQRNLTRLFLAAIETTSGDVCMNIAAAQFHLSEARRQTVDETRPSVLQEMRNMEIAVKTVRTEGC